MADDSTNKVVLVDDDGNRIGECEKMRAHLEGKHHLAFSVFLFDLDGRWLLQKRAEDKYHSGGLWSNTCCSHPGPGEDLHEAAMKRLQQEMGIECEISEAFVFTYRAELDGGLVEHETDQVFIGEFDGDPVPNPAEASDWKWVDTDSLQRDIAENPESYSAWFRICHKQVMDRREARN